VVVVVVGVVAAVVVASSRMSWNTSFTTVLGYRTEDLSSIPGRKKTFSCFRHVEFYLQLYVGGKSLCREMHSGIQLNLMSIFLPLEDATLPSVTIFPISLCVKEDSP